MIADLTAVWATLVEVVSRWWPYAAIVVVVLVVVWLLIGAETVRTGVALVPQRRWCSCAASAVDPHTPDQHTSCRRRGRRACGACDTCMSIGMRTAATREHAR